MLDNSQGNTPQPIQSPSPVQPSPVPPNQPSVPQAQPPQPLPPTELPQRGPQPLAPQESNPQIAAQELAKTIQNSREVLVRATTVFPFNLFPDTVTLFREKLTIVHRWFFKAGESVSIRIEDILDATVDAGPYFATLKLNSRFYSTNKPYIIRYLHKDEAIAMKQIIQGYTIALQKKIDCSSLPTDQLRTMLRQLGAADDEA